MVTNIQVISMIKYLTDTERERISATACWGQADTRRKLNCQDKLKANYSDFTPLCFYFNYEQKLFYK